MTKDEFIATKTKKMRAVFVTVQIVLGGIVVLFLSILDYFAKPDHFNEFLSIRIVVFALAVVLYKFNKATDQRYPIFLLVITECIVSCMVEYMIFCTGGHTSTYYAGMIIISLFVAAFTPVNTQTAIGLSMIPFLIYIIPILLWDKIIDKATFWNNIVFLFSSIVIGSYYRFLTWKLFKQNLSLEYDIAQERDRTQDAWGESEEKFRIMTNTAMDAILLLNEKGEIAFWNPAAEGIFLCSNEDALGKPLSSFIPLLEFSPQTEAASSRELGPSFINKTLEMTVSRGDDTMLPVEIAISAIRFKQKAHYLSIIRDIAKRKDSEAALKESEAKYRTLIENIHLGIYRSTYAEEPVFLQINPAMINILRSYASLHELHQYTPRDIYQDCDAHDRITPQLQKRGSIKNEVVKHKTRDGRVIYLSITATAQHNSDGSLKWIDGVVEDITAEKTIQEQLLQSQKLESVGALAGGIAHNFNNIVTTILGNTDVLMENLQAMPYDVAIMRRIQNIENASKKAGAIVSKLLSFAMKAPHEVLPFYLHEALTETLRLFKDVLTSKKYRMEIKYCKDNPVVDGDPLQLEQVLMNLLVNARDAMSSGGTFFIETQVVDLEHPSDDGVTLTPVPHVLWTVSDTGCGMSEETLKSIFDPFFTTKVAGRGTGLGLASVYGIIKDHKGTISVESSLGKGSCFSIYLPLSARAFPQLPLQRGPLDQGTELLPDIANEDVLHYMRDII